MSMDLNTALMAGQNGSTYGSQVANALAYWQSVVANRANCTLGDPGYGDGSISADANTAVTLLTAEQARIADPASH